MPFQPHSYGAATGGTKKTLQEASRPNVWENFVSSGKIRTEEVYGTEAAILAAYESAVAAAGEHDIVTLNAQTDGGSVAAPAQRIVTISNSPAVASPTTYAVYSSGMILAPGALASGLVASSVLAFSAAAAAAGWNWYTCAEPPSADTPLTLVADSVPGTSGSVAIPAELHGTTRWVVLATSPSVPVATFGELLMTASTVIMEMYETADAAAIGAELIDVAGVPVYRILVGGPHLGGTQIAGLSLLCFPISATSYPETLTRIQLGGISYIGSAHISILGAGGNVLAERVVAFAGGVAALALPLPAAAVELRVNLTDGDTTPIPIPTTAAAAVANNGLPFGYTALGDRDYLVRSADPTPTLLTLTSDGGTLPTYTGTLSVTSYIRNPDNLTPQTAVTKTESYTKNEETYNPMDEWDAYKKLAYEAAYNNQNSFVLFSNWYKVEDYISEGELRLYVDQKRTVQTWTHTYTWASTNPLASEPVPGITPPSGFVLQSRSATPLTGYAEQWYQHTTIYSKTIE